MHGHASRGEFTNEFRAFPLRPHMTKQENYWRYECGSSEVPQPTTRFEKFPPLYPSPAFAGVTVIVWRERSPLRMDLPLCALFRRREAAADDGIV